MIVDPPPRPVICSVSPGDDIAIDMVRAWLAENNYTSDVVRIKRDSGSVYAELK